MKNLQWVVLAAMTWQIVWACINSLMEDLHYFTTENHLTVALILAVVFVGMRIKGE